MNKKKDKRLFGSDIILNLAEIDINSIDSCSSSSCSGGVSFNINCETKHGYCEDPRFLGRIKILETKKEKSRNTYLLKVKFEKEKEGQ